MQGTTPSRNRGSAPKASGTPEPPDWLNGDELAEFSELLRAFEAVPGLVGKIDALAVACLAEAICEVRAARDEIAEHGATCTSEKGGIYQHPAVGRKNKALERVRYWTARFGMSPSDRASLDVDLSATNENPFAKFLESAQQSLNHSEFKHEG